MILSLFSSLMQLPDRNPHQQIFLTNELESEFSRRLEIKLFIVSAEQAVLYYGYNLHIQSWITLCNEALA